MSKRWQGRAALGLGVALLGGGAIGASAFGSTPAGPARTSVIESVQAKATDLADLVGLGDDEGSVAPGTIDDGKDLLPQATITLDQAIQAAQAAVPGALAEVDLEYYRGHLVFNVDSGGKDVKVDAGDGTVLAALSDD